MKKIISIFLLSLFCLAFPFETVHAKSAPKNPKEQFNVQVKEKRKLIDEKTKHNKKIQLQINKKAQKASDLYMSIFGEDLVPSEEDSKKVEEMEMELGKIAEHLIHIEQAISRRVKTINNSIKGENFDQALSAYDGLIALMNKQTMELHKENDFLQTYITFLESLGHK